jgi:radical SAM superfamily enzyme YgiQ (UPF0313 family)
MARSIILVDLYWTRDKDPRVPLGHASLLAALGQEPGLDVHPVVVPVNLGKLDVDELATTILECAWDKSPDAADLAIGAYVWAEELIQRLLPLLRARGFRGRIILGGPQISYAEPGLEPIYPDTDAFVRGYGEDALLQLVRAPGRPPITGVHYAGDVDRCEQAQASLDLLPSPWLTEAVPIAGQRFIRWETQRGCPFRCAFCQHREPGARLKRRELAVSRILSEVQLFCRHDVKEIAVLDPIFNLGRNATDILLAFVENSFKGRLSLQCRAESTTEDFLETAAALDVRLEFGLQTIHEKEAAAVQRRNQMDKVDSVLAAVRRRNIAHEVSLIFGLPEQTLDSFLASVQWCLERGVPVIKAFPLMLLRGTQLDRERLRWGFYERGIHMPVVVTANSFDERDWTEMARVAEALRLTEGRHPSQVRELRRLAARCEIDMSRWQPLPTQEAA